MFSIDSSTGIVSVAAGKSPDYETTTSYTLTVSAKDKNGAASLETKTATTAVIITITGVNEADPTFGSNPYPVTKAEDLAVGSAVVTVGGEWL